MPSPSVTPSATPANFCFSTILLQQGGSSADGAASSDEEDEDIDAEDDFHYEMEEEPTYVFLL